MNIELSEQQQICVDQIWINKVGIAWWKVGEGKTRLAIALMERVRQNVSLANLSGVCFAVLRRKAFWDLQNELKKTNTDKNWIVEEFNPELVTLPKVGQWKLWMLSHAMLQKYEKTFSQAWFKEIVKFIYIDELYLYSNPTSKRSKAIKSLTKNCRVRRIGVSGTIMPTEDNTAIWGQTKAIGIEFYLEKTLTAFRSAYQICSVQDMQRYKVVTRINKPGSVKRITEKISKFVNIYFPRGQRKISTSDITLPPTKQQTILIKKIRKDYFYEQQGKIIETRTVLEVATRLRQIASGWLPNPETPSLPFRIPTNKTTYLKEYIDELLVAGESCLIWVAFRHDVDLVASLFDFPIYKMVGGKDFDSSSFGLASKTKPVVVVATEQCGSSVNHFKDMRYVIYYSFTYDWLSLQQSMGRTDRKDGQHNECFYKFLLIDEPAIDSYVLENARSAGGTEQTFLKVFQKWS